MRTGGDFSLFGINHLAVHVFHGHNYRGNVFIQRISRFGFAVFERHNVAQYLNRFADVGNGLRAQVGNIQRKQGIKLFVGLNRLLDVGILNQLIGKFSRIHRIKRVLIFELGRQQGQKGVHVRREGLAAGIAASRIALGIAGKSADICCHFSILLCLYSDIEGRFSVPCRF